MTTGGVAGVNGVNVPNLYVYLYAPTPENRDQVWRVFHPRPRLGIYLHVSEKPEVQQAFGSASDCDIVAFQLDPDKQININAGITGVPGALPFPIQLPNTFNASCIHGATGMLQLIGARYSAMSIQSQSYGPVLYQASAAAGNGSSGAPVFDSGGKFVGVQCANERGNGFMVSSVVVRDFMWKIIPIIADVQRLQKYNIMLQNPSLSHSIKFTTNQQCENIEEGIKRALRAMPWKMTLC